MLRCPACDGQFKISAKETVFYLDNMRGGSTMVIGPDSGQVLDGEELRAGDRLGGFIIDRELARGGMGIVYLATQISLGKQRALKVLPKELAGDADFLKRFHRETRALAQLDHPNIVSVIDTGHYQGIYYLVMEYVEGVTLRDLLEERKLTPEEALQLVPQICSALEYAHSKGVIHRDIKPENLILDRQQNLKIADFGLSKILGEKQFSRLTATNTVMGTYEYMAPEQRSGAGGVDHRADLYSLGVILYEMLTGDIPAGNFEPPSKRNDKLGADVDRIIMRVLERDPNRRYQKASELATDIKQARQGKLGLSSDLDELNAALTSIDWRKLANPILKFIKQHNWWFYVLLIMAFFAQSAIPIWLFIGLTVWFWDKFDDKDEDQKSESIIENVDPTTASASASASAGGSVAVARIADSQAKGKTIHAEIEISPDVPTGRTSKLSVLSLGFAVMLLMGGVTLLLLNTLIRGGLMSLSTGAMSWFLVLIALAGLIPGAGLLWLASVARHRCGQKALGGKGMATMAILISVFYLGTAVHLFRGAGDDLVSWRTHENLALQKDKVTLDWLENEIKAPASEETRSRAARVLAEHAPQRALPYVAHSNQTVRYAILTGFRECQNDKLAVEAALKALGQKPGNEEGRLACWILEDHHPDSALPLLFKQLKQRPSYRQDLAQAILAYRTDKAVPALEWIGLERGSRYVNQVERRVARALEKIGSPAAVGALVNLLGADAKATRKEADRSLRRITGVRRGINFDSEDDPKTRANQQAIKAWRETVSRWQKRRN